jgi:molybdate-binding protein
MGSLGMRSKSLRKAAGVAGFHVPIAGCTGLNASPFCAGLARRDRLIRFVDRDQVDPSARESGTGQESSKSSPRDSDSSIANEGRARALLIDQMIADAGVELTTLNGYQREEFTHWQWRRR